MINLLKWLLSLMNARPDLHTPTERPVSPLDVIAGNPLSEPQTVKTDASDAQETENKQVSAMQSFPHTVLTLKRDLLINSAGSIGALYFKGKLFCHICEDTKRREKVPGFTRIEAGTYKINLLKTSNPDTVRGRALKYDARWPDWHNGIMELEAVPNFKYIQLHPGNKPDDTLGCLLPGVWNGRSMSVGRSAITYEKLYKRFAPIAESGNLYIEIIDGIQDYVD